MITDSQCCIAPLVDQDPDGFGYCSCCMGESRPLWEYLFEKQFDKNLTKDEQEEVKRFIRRIMKQNE